jgi:hypothetical protein
MGPWGRLLALALAFGWSGAPAQGSPRAQAQPGTHSIAPGAADPSHTRAAIAEVLARPEFADLRTDPDSLWRRVIEWLGSLWKRDSSAIGHLPEWLLWLIVGWIVLTLLAILAHLMYSLWQLLSGLSRPSSSGPRALRHEGELLGIRNLDFETVHAEARRRLAAGDWLAATRYYYVAAILGLDRQGAIEFRPSKTNRDYFGELRARARLQGPFGRLTERFESIIYAGRAATASTSCDMAETVESLLHEPARAAAN